MINQILKLEDFGIFSSFNEINVAPFQKNNLFYGNNGSGKSTLAHLFSILENNERHNRFPNSSWEIDTSQGKFSKINETNPLNVRVFNKDFVEENIDWNSLLKGILLVSSEKIDEKKSINEKENYLKIIMKGMNELNDKLNGNKTSKIKGLKAANEEFLSESAKNIKNKFISLNMRDSRLSNYNKTIFLNFIEKNKDKINTDYILSEEELKEFSLSVQPQEKYSITNLKTAFDIEKLAKVHIRIDDLNEVSITSDVIEELENDKDLSDWVYKGLKIHGSDSEICEFCGEALTKERLNFLNSHFSDSYENLKEDLKNGIEYLENIYMKLKLDFPTKDSFYLEFYNKYDVIFESYKILDKKILLVLNNWREILDLKLDNPFECEKRNIKKIDDETVIEYKRIRTELQEIINFHNNKLTNLEKEINTIKEKLELSFVIEEVLRYKYFEKKQNEELVYEELKKQRILITSVESEVKILKESLSNEVFGAENFNNKLHLFIGRDDLCLRVNNQGGYHLERNAVSAQNLSEGEKTAIALIYFLTKLNENENKIEETIVVFDDPISSFDNNHLFYATDYIVRECKEAKQLFVFTHNFHFFSLMKEWCSNPIEYYVIKAINKNGKRIGILENAEPIVTQFSSEYHMLFNEVYKYIKSTDKSYMSNHLIANTSRQLLESFLTFKYGRKKLEKCFGEITDFPEINKVRKFVNHFSHRADHGNTIKGFNDSIFAEADLIVPLVFKLIEHVDKVHYDSMHARLNENANQKQKV